MFKYYKRLVDLKVTAIVCIDSQSNAIFYMAIDVGHLKGLCMSYTSKHDVSLDYDIIITEEEFFAIKKEILKLAPSTKDAMQLEIDRLTKKYEYENPM
jgi:hypothetical protein